MGEEINFETISFFGTIQSRYSDCLLGGVVFYYKLKKFF